MKIVELKLKHLLMSIFLIGVVTLIFTSTAYADSAVEYGNSGTYGYNSGAYNISTDHTDERASHSTTEWQSLGSGAGFGDYGVSWSVDGGSFANVKNLYVGQTVKFKFNMHSAKAGEHKANILKGWIDWNVNNLGTIVADTNDPNSSYGMNIDGDYEFDNVLVTGHNLVKRQNGNWYRDNNGDVIYDENTEFFSNDILLGTGHLGTAFLRARVSCTESIRDTTEMGGNNQWSHNTGAYKTAFEAYKDYSQGEIEDWTFNVAGIQGAPEPATMVLFGMGLIGLARIGRKKA